MYRTVFYPLLKQYEPYVDQKLLDAQAAAKDSVVSMQKTGKEVIVKQLHAVQQSGVVERVGQAIIASATELAQQQQKQQQKAASNEARDGKGTQSKTTSE